MGRVVVLEPGKVEILGRGGNRLEIELLDNGDFFVHVAGVEGQSACGDFPNYLNGGGDKKAYEDIRRVYAALVNRKRRVVNV